MLRVAYTLVLNTLGALAGTALILGFFTLFVVAHNYGTGTPPLQGTLIELLSP